MTQHAQAAEAGRGDASDTCCGLAWGLAWGRPGHGPEPGWTAEAGAAPQPSAPHPPRFTSHPVDLAHLCHPYHLVG